jgi:hypothetical protein
MRELCGGPTLPTCGASTLSAFGPGAPH